MRKLFKKNNKTNDPLEWRLDTISDLTRGLGKTDFNNLMDAAKAMFEARQKLRRVKTEEEKEVEDIENIEKSLSKS